MNGDQQQALVARIAGELLASAHAAGKSDAFTEGDLFTTCLTDAATLVAYVSDSKRFEILMEAAQLSLEEIDEGAPVEQEESDDGLQNLFGRLESGLMAARANDEDDPSDEDLIIGPEAFDLSELARVKNAGV